MKRESFLVTRVCVLVFLFAAHNAWAQAVSLPKARKDLLGADVDAAQKAAQDLGKLKQPAALSALLDGLAMGLHPSVAKVALASVATHRSMKAIDVLMYYTHHRNQQVRAASILALAELQTPRAQKAWRLALHDASKEVRAAAAQAVAKRQDKGSTQTLIKLLKKGDEGVPGPLAAIATADTARRVAELIGDVPHALLADCVGQILLKKDLGQEQIYVQLVQTLAKIPGEESLIALTTYLGAVPEKPVRQSRRLAQAIYEQRLEGE